MKTLFSFLTIAFLSCIGAKIAQAEVATTAPSTRLYAGTFTFFLSTDGSYKYTPVAYEYAEDPTNNVPLAKNEVFRALIVRDKRIVTPTMTPSVAIDAAGQIVKVKLLEDEDGNPLDADAEPVEYAIDAKWMDVRYSYVENNAYTYAYCDYITVGDALGVPNNLSSSSTSGGWKKYTFEVYTETDLAEIEGYEDYYYTYLYLVALDTRMGTGGCEGQPQHVQAYAMSLCAGKNNGNTAEEKYPAVRDTVVDGFMMTSPRAWYVGAEGGIFVWWPGYIGSDSANPVGRPWQSCAEIKSLVVDGVEKTGDDLTDYLTPKVASMTTSADGLTLTATAPDVQYYTLYTTDKLSDASWMPFEEFVNNDENFVDKTIGKRYTRFRIDGKSLSIPVISGETSRFYQLRGE